MDASNSNHTFCDTRWTNAEFNAWQAAPSTPTETSIPASANRLSPLPAVRESGSTMPATTLFFRARFFVRFFSRDFSCDF